MDIQQIATYVLAGYETLIRALPTKKSYSIIHSILKALVFVSGLLDRKGKGGAVLPILSIALMLSAAGCKSVESVTCGHTKYIDITVLKSGKYVSTTVPFCDTIIIVEKPKHTRQ